MLIHCRSRQTAGQRLSSRTAPSTRQSRTLSPHHSQFSISTFHAFAFTQNYIRFLAFAFLSLIDRHSIARILHRHHWNPSCIGRTCFYWLHSSCTHTQHCTHRTRVQYSVLFEHICAARVCNNWICAYMPWCDFLILHHITSHTSISCRTHRAAAEYAQIYPNMTTQKKYYGVIPSRAPT